MSQGGPPEGGVARTKVIRETYGWVVPQDGPHAGRVFPLEKSAVLGSASSCDVVITGAAARHLQLTCGPGEAWTVHPLDSASLEVDGFRINDATPLKDGARLRIGATEVIFKCVTRG